MCRPRLCYHISTIFYTNIESYSTEQLQVGLYYGPDTSLIFKFSFFMHLKPFHLFKSNSRFQIIPKFS